MKIAIVQGAFLPVPPLRGGAVEKIWFALGQEFARQGHTVTHYSRACDGLPPNEVIAGVKHIRVRGADSGGPMPRRQWQDLLYTRRVARVLEPADVVVTNTFWSPIILSARRHGPVWVHIQRYPKGQMRFYRGAARLQTVARVIAHAIVEQAPDVAKKVVVIPNPLPPLVALNPLPARDPRLVLFVGRIHPEKGVELVLEAARLAKAANPPLRFRIVGPSESRFGGGGAAFQQTLEGVAAAGGGNVEFVGPIFDEAALAREFAAAGIFVYPSLAAKGEASPVAPLEAMARGCTVVTSDLACFDDTIGVGPYAHRFDHTAADAAQRFATILSDLAADPAALEKNAAAARARADQFTVEKIAAQYLAAFQAVAR